MPSPILTDGATFTCPHGGTGTVKTGISVSAIAANVTIGGQHPILIGATIGGFTLALGCGYQVSGVSTPCVSFILPAPSEKAVTIGGLAVFTANDAQAIAGIPSTGNGVPGLKIGEPQTLVSA